ncbi:MAG: conjugal transfer protein TraG [Candidatus Omnitrophica bacterium]|nr:conjugal transfer protein TraG [Candidatus Omnitrophota bacterium]
MSDLTGFILQQVNHMVTVGRLLLGTFFIIATVSTYLGSVSGKGGFTSLFVRLTLAFLLLQNYVPLIDVTENMVVSLNERVNPNQDWISNYAKMNQTAHKEYADNVKRDWGDMFRNFGKSATNNLVTSFSFIFNSLALKVMSIIRRMLLAILKVIGPLLIPFIVFGFGSRIFSGWYTSFISTLSWPIIWGLVLSLAVKAGNIYGSSGAGLEDFVGFNFAVGFVIIFVPMIVSALATGMGIGAAASFAGTGATTMAFSTMRMATPVGIRGGAGALGGAMGAGPQVAAKAANAVKSGNANFLGAKLSPKLAPLAGVAGMMAGGMRGGFSGAIKGVGKKVGYKPTFQEAKLVKGASQQTRNIKSKVYGVTRNAIGKMAKAVKPVEGMRSFRLENPMVDKIRKGGK